MPEVISNTSPIQYLHQSDLLELLPALYDQVTVPEGVVVELEAGRRQGVPLPDVRTLPWVRVRRAPRERLLTLVTDLGRGEREVLALAAEIPDSLAILDDALARHYARVLDVAFTGTLGVLLRGKQAGHLTAVEPAVRQLEMLGFRLDAGTRAAILDLAEETPD